MSKEGSSISLDYETLKKTGEAYASDPMRRHVCPNCGYCPCCGRGGYWQPYQPIPWYPQPNWPYQPWIVWCGDNTASSQERF